MSGEKVQHKDVIVAPDGRALIYGTISVVATDALTGSVGKANPEASLNSKLKEPIDSEQGASVPWAIWGENDDFPIKLTEKLGYVGVLQSAIEVNSTMHYGAGVIWVKDKIDKKGKRIIDIQDVPFWKKLQRTSGIDLVMSEAIESLETFYFSVVEVILNNGRTEVSSSQCLDTVFCRMKKKDSSGKITHVYYDSNFGSGQNPKKPQEIPVYDPANPTKHQKFVLILGYRCFGKFYYPEPNYYSCIRNGWADVAISVPKILKSIYRNQMSIKYLIKIPLESMRRKYHCWDAPPDCKNEEEVMNWQLEKMREEQDAINTHLTSEENAGKGIVTFNDTREEGTGITIEPIKSFFENNGEIITAAAANSEMLFAALVDPSAIGHGIPGGKNLSGSGSDKREARQAKQASLKRERLVSLLLPNAIAVIHNLDEDIYPTYLDTDTSQTLDENPTGKQNVVQA